MMTHLEGRGHEVKAVSYDRGLRNLRDDFDVFEVEGLHDLDRVRETASPW